VIDAAEGGRNTGPVRNWEDLAFFVVKPGHAIVFMSRLRHKYQHAMLR
jgi:hypothetical protein